MAALGISVSRSLQAPWARSLGWRRTAIWPRRSERDDRNGRRPCAPPRKAATSGVTTSASRSQSRVSLRIELLLLEEQQRTQDRAAERAGLGKPDVHVVTTHL